MTKMKVGRRIRMRFLNNIWKKISPKSYYTNPFSVLIHPIDSYLEMKEKKTGSTLYMIIILVLYYFSYMIMQVGAGFMYSDFKPQYFNMLDAFNQSVMLILFFAVANWAFTTLFEGEGKVLDILIYVSYALIPIIAYRILYTICSNVLIPDEMTFILMIGNILNVWFIILVVIGLQALHNFSFIKTIINGIFSIVGMGIIFFILFLLMTLYKQLYIFVNTLLIELQMRLFM